MKTKSPYTKKSGRRSFCIFLLVIPLLIACSKQPVYPEPTLKGSEIVIDAEKLRSESPVFFTFHHHGKRINFFVLKVHEKVLSFLDACASCYPSKRGYVTDNGYLICRTCNVRYSPSDVEKGIGSCSPITVEGHLQDGKYLIPISFLEKAIDKSN